MLLNLSLLITGAFLVSLTYRDWPVVPDRALDALRVVLAALVMLLLVAYGIPAGEFKFDLRYVPVALVALRYGPWVALLSFVPAMLWRLVEAPVGGVMAIWNAASVIFLVGLVRPHLSISGLSWRHLRLLPLPFVGVGLALLTTPQGRADFLIGYPSMLIVNALSFFLVLAIFHSRLRLLRLTHQLSLQVMTDDLTGLGNRRRFDEDLARCAAGTPLVLLDVDGLQLVNEQRGQANGDRALRHIGWVLTDLAPQRAYRLGGDEFALLPPQGAEGQAQQLVEKVLARVSEPGEGPWSALSLSAGLAVRQADEQPGELLHRADEALYLAKTNGRGRLVVASPRARATAGDTSGGEVRPRYSLWQAQRTTLALLTQRRAFTPADWQDVLALAVSSVDGAQAGSLTVREGRDFRLIAQCGFGQEIVGTYLSEDATLSWYGQGLERWREGEPRVWRGAQVERAFVRADPHYLPQQVDQFKKVGRSDGIRATLCVPVVLNGVVVAHLNLDSFSSEAAFGPRVAEDARVFADQLAALVQLQERWEELELLGRLHHELSAEDEEVEGRLTAIALGLLRASHATLLRYDAGHDRLEAVELRGSARPVLPLHIPRGHGPAWRALHGGQVVAVADLRREISAGVSETVDLEDAALLAVPLLSRRREPLGVLALTRSVNRPFQDNDRQLGAMLAQVGSRVLERHGHLNDLHATLDAALHTLGVALEARDFETQGHTRRVSDLSASLGAALQLSEARMTALRHGAALHDIGKLCIPDALLLKPGRLTPQEYETVKQHAALGAEIAARIPFLSPEAHEIIRHHHERWDGQGYPDALAGESIPLLARIFALCDVYDALISERPYKSALPVPEALSIIEQGGGSQFDPQLAALFVQLVSRQTAALPLRPLPPEAPLYADTPFP